MIEAHLEYEILIPASSNVPLLTRRLKPALLVKRPTFPKRPILMKDYLPRSFGAIVSRNTTLLPLGLGILWRFLALPMTTNRVTLIEGHNLNNFNLSHVRQ
jgi:hypothetical protein